MDNRHGLVVNTRLTEATGSAEPEAALAMAAQIAGQHRVTLGGDKGYDQKKLVRELRAYQVTPHIARKVHSAIDRRTTRHSGYAISQIKRKRVEEIGTNGVSLESSCNLATIGPLTFFNRFSDPPQIVVGYIRKLARTARSCPEQSVGGGSKSCRPAAGSSRSKGSRSLRESWRRCAARSRSSLEYRHLHRRIVSWNDTAPNFLRRPVIAIETVRQLHDHHPRRTVDHSSQVTLTDQIISNKRVPRNILPLLIITRTDFDLSRQHHYDLARWCMMPGLIQTNRQFDEADAGRRPRVRLPNRVSELSGSRLGNWDFDFLKARAAIGGYMKAGNFIGISAHLL
jgi:hypothetical protein